MPDSNPRVATQPESETQTSVAKQRGNLSADAATSFFRQAEIERNKQSAPESTPEAAPSNEPFREPTPIPPAPEEGKSEAKQAESADAEPEVTPEPKAAEEAAPAHESNDADDVLSQLSLDDKSRAAVQELLRQREEKYRAKLEKRIGKEVARTRQLERDLETVRSLAEKTAAEKTETVVVAQPTADNPLADVMDEQSLAAKVAEAKQWKRWAERQLDRDDLDVAPARIGNKEYTRQEIKEIKHTYAEILEDHIPAREKFLQARAQSSEKARSVLPTIADRTNEDFLAAQAFKRSHQGLVNDPEADYIAALAIRGLRAIEAESKAKAAPKPAASEKAKPRFQSQASEGGSTTAPREVGTSAKERQMAALKETLNQKKGISARQAEDYFLQQELARIQH